MNLGYSRWLLVMLFLASSWPLAAQNGLELRVPSGKVDAGDELHLQVSGRWLNGCVPELASARIEGMQIRLRAIQRLSPDCLTAPTDLLLDTRVLPNAMRLRRTGVYRVRLDVETPDALETHAFALLQIGAVGSVAMPEAGFWWSEVGGEFPNAGPGLGFHLEVQQSQLSALVAGYDAHGEPRWWLGAGEVQGSIAVLELSALLQGGGPFQAYQSPKSSVTEGMAWFELQGPGRAVIWLVDRISENSTALDVRPQSIVRFNFAATAAEGMLGRWWVGEDSGIAKERAHLWVEFTKVQTEPDGFSLHDAEGWYRLQCQQSSKANDAAPTACQLYSAQEPIGFEFDRLAIQQWRGRSSRGASAVAIRVDDMAAEDSSR